MAINYYWWIFKPYNKLFIKFSNWILKSWVIIWFDVGRISLTDFLFKLFKTSLKKLNTSFTFFDWGKYFLSLKQT